MLMLLLYTVMPSRHCTIVSSVLRSTAYITLGEVLSLSLCFFSTVHNNAIGNDMSSDNHQQMFSVFGGESRPPTREKM